MRPLLRQCIATFAVAEGWLLLDIGCFVLFLHFTDVASTKHRIQGIILDISSNRLFKAVRVGNPTETRNHPFPKVKFANKGTDALNSATC